RGPRFAFRWSGGGAREAPRSDDEEVVVVQVGALVDFREDLVAAALRSVLVVDERALALLVDDLGVVALRLPDLELVGAQLADRSELLEDVLRQVEDVVAVAEVGDLVELVLLELG